MRAARFAAGLAALAFGVAPDQALGRQFGRGRWRVRSELMGPHDEVLEVVPRGEQVVDGQDMEVQEELAAAAETGADQAVVPFGELEDGVRQERKDVEGGERVCQMLFAVAEVVVKMVALGLALKMETQGIPMISHGICEACKKEAMDEIPDYNLILNR